MSSSRSVSQVVMPPQPVVEGAGVHLGRSIGTRRLDHLDPFLLLDHFESVEPADYRAGFPYHPHRGIETVTFVRKGEVRHRDSLGHQGSIGAGDIQWMTSGSGILHEEMPQVRPEGIAGALDVREVLVVQLAPEQGVPFLGTYREAGRAVKRGKTVAREVIANRADRA